MSLNFSCTINLNKNLAHVEMVWFHLKKENRLIGVCFTILLFSLVFARFFMAPSLGIVIRVPADYPTIQEAIDAAPAESVISVSPGIYHENLTINKTLTVTGQDRMTTIIDGGFARSTVEIVADRVALENFTISGNSQASDEGGVFLFNSSFCRITNNIVLNTSPAGVGLWYSHNNSIEGNFIAYSGADLPGWTWGWNIGLAESNNNTITGNILSNSIVDGISSEMSNGTSIAFNVIQNGDVGISLWHSDYSVIDHNAFLNIRNFRIMIEAYDNTWSKNQEGNYWDNYLGLDDGNDSRVIGDGVGDTDLPHLGVDNYPLVRPPFPIPVVIGTTLYPVAIEGNSTISMFRFAQSEKMITFNVTGPEATAGYCNVTIPKSLLRDSPWRILRNSTDVTAETIISENETYTSLYLAYDHAGIANIQIIGTWVVPEFSPKVSLALVLLFSTMLIVLRKRRRT